MLQVYNIINQNINLDLTLFFTFSNLFTKGHRYKLYKPCDTKEVCQHSFSYLIINNWNRLPDEVVGAYTMNNLNNKQNTAKFSFP